MRVLRLGTVLVVAGVVLVGVGVTGGTTNATRPDPEHKVWICHATSGMGELKNGYNLIEVDESAVEAHLAHVMDNSKFGLLVDMLADGPNDDCGGIPDPTTTSAPVQPGDAAISLDKQMSATEVMPGDELNYTLVAHNTGARVLNDLVITDLLPEGVTLSDWSIVDDAGTCSLTDASQPQTVTCELDDSLPVDGSTKTITLTVTVDADVASETVLLNQARVVGSFEVPSDSLEDQLNVVRAQAEPAALSCSPLLAGTVCDLSAKVGTTVLVPVVTTTTEGQSLAPVTTTTVTTTTVTPTTVAKALPVTGNGQESSEMLLLGFLLMGLGSVVLLLSRRPAES